MSSEWIPLAECQDRHIYRLHSRNLMVGVFRQAVGGFIGIREKFGELYLFEEYHHETSQVLGTVTPDEDIGVLPAEIELRARVDTGCSTCHRPITYRKERNQASQWPWVHDDPTDELECPADHPGGSSATYAPLFDYLEHRSRISAPGELEAHHAWLDQLEVVHDLWSPEDFSGV